MTQRIRLIRFASLVVVWMILVVDCKPLLPTSDSTIPAAPASFSLGKELDSFEGVVERAGGKITLTEAGGELEGMWMEIPAGAFDEDVKIKITRQEIRQHSLGKDITPITPLIHIDLGGLQPQEYLTLQVPVKVPKDYFAAPFHIDPESGELDAAAVVKTEPGAITFIANHFSDFVMLMAAEEALTGSFETSFQMGRDHFPFANYGSVVARGGHCAGQSLATLYYHDQKTGEPLISTFDGFNGIHGPTPEFWEDDVIAYQLSSLAQLAHRNTPFDVAYWKNLQADYPQRSYFTISLIMMLTGKPQLVGVREGSDGHALIAYKKVGSDIYVYDPNSPLNSERKLHFDEQSGTFLPYETPSRVGETNKNFSTIYYISKRDAADWNMLDYLWNEALDGEFTNNPFPKISLKAIDKDEQGQSLPAVDLVQNFETRNMLIKVFHPEMPFPARLTVFTGDSDGSVNQEAQTMLPGEVSLPLWEGDNHFGFLLEELVGGVGYLWAGFEWVNIIQTDEPQEPGEASQGSERLSLQECDMTPYLIFKYEEPEIMTLTNQACSYICKAYLNISHEIAEDVTVYYYFSDNSRSYSSGEHWHGHEIMIGDTFRPMFYNIGIVTSECPWATKKILKIGATLDTPGCYWMMKDIGFDVEKIGQYDLQWAIPENPCP